MNERPTWIVINCIIAWIISLLATCKRLRCGCLIWNPKTKQIVAVGYNGAPSGQPHCIDIGCVMEDNHCINCLHSEPNALYWASTNSYGCWMFINYNPCLRCCNAIIQGKIERVYYTKSYGNPVPSIQKLNSANIDVHEVGLKFLVDTTQRAMVEWVR